MDNVSLINNNNGIYDETILIAPEDDIYVPFEYTFHKALDNNVKSNLNYYFEQIRTKHNLIVSSNMILTIAYLILELNDLLIYDRYSNNVITFSAFVQTRVLMNNPIFNLTQLKLIYFLKTCFQTTLSFMKIKWNLSLAINVTLNKQLIRNSINVKMILEYIKNYNVDYKDFNKKYVLNVLKIQDDMNILKTKKDVNRFVIDLIEHCKSSEYFIIHSQPF